MQVHDCGEQKDKFNITNNTRCKYAWKVCAHAKNLIAILKKKKSCKNTHIQIIMVQEYISGNTTNYILHWSTCYKLINYFNYLFLS